MLAFFLAMFLGNSATAAARACALLSMGEDQPSIQALEARGIVHLCPEADGAIRLSVHCAQGFKGSEQGPPADAFLAFAPAPAVLHVSAPAGQSAVGIAAPDFVGPPLTILFRNLRN